MNEQLACTELELKNQYPNSSYLLFASQMESPNNMTDGYITNSLTGYVTELNNLASYPLNFTNISALRPVVQFDFNNNQCVVHKVNFRCYNLVQISANNVNISQSSHTITPASTTVPINTTSTGNLGASPINMSTIGSQGTTVDTVSASTLTGGIADQDYIFEEITGNWQPNYFRPAIIINGTNILGNTNSTFFSGNNLGDRSIGFGFPFKQDLDCTIGSINSIQINAIAGKVNIPALTLQRFFITCELEILWK